VTWAALAAALEPHGPLGAAVAALGRLVAWTRDLGPVAGAVVALAGLVLLTGGRRLRRPVAALGGAAVGALGAMALGPVLPELLSASGWAWLGAGLCGAASAAAPLLFPALAGCLVGGVLGARVPVGGLRWVGAAVAAAVGAALLSVGARSATALLAALAGGLAVGLGLVTLGGERALAVQVAARPLVLLGVALVLAVGGTVFQLSEERGGRGRLPDPPRLPRD
jgi:hypothetical protein